MTFHFKPLWICYSLWKSKTVSTKILFIFSQWYAGTSDQFGLYNSKFTENGLKLMNWISERSFAVRNTYQSVQANITKVALVFTVYRLSNTLQPIHLSILAVPQFIDSLAHALTNKAGDDSPRMILIQMIKQWQNHTCFGFIWFKHFVLFLDFMILFNGQWNVHSLPKKSIILMWSKLISPNFARWEIAISLLKPHLTKL